MEGASSSELDPNEFKENDFICPIFQTLNPTSDLQSDSDGGGSYAPSVGQIMRENCDIAMLTPSPINSLSQTEELENLLKESVMPIGELMKQYQYNGNEVNLDFAATDRKRRYIARHNYNEDADLEDLHSKDAPRKSTLIGKEHQIDIPDHCTNDLIAEIESEDEVIWNPHKRFPNSVPLAEFVNQLGERYKIYSEDEHVMKFYMKHEGSVTSALKDIEGLGAIEHAQNSPLTNFTEEECLNFKNAMLQFGKDFPIIRHCFYPHRSVKDVVNMYYIWKKTPLYEAYLEESRMRYRQRLLETESGRITSAEGGENFATSPDRLKLENHVALNGGSDSMQDANEEFSPTTSPEESIPNYSWPRSTTDGEGSEPPSYGT